MSTAEISPPRPLLLSDRGCPYAHRVLSLLDHLGVTHEARQAPIGQLPDGLRSWSPSGRVPLLVHGEIVIGESRVMLDYLAEAYAFASAYPRELAARTLQQHAMALMDIVVAPRLSLGDKDLDEPRVAECLDIFESVAVATPFEPCLLAFHFAPVWLRFQWWRPNGAVTRAIRSRPRLAAWLDRAATLASVARTGPRQQDSEDDFHAACAIMNAAKPSTPPG